MKVCAFIPARAGSKRIADKNIRPLQGHPLLAYSVCAAVDSGIFEKVICVTDSAKYAEIAAYYGAWVPALRPESISGEKSPDMDWVNWILGELRNRSMKFDAFSILRPTSPCRLSSTIRRAWTEFLGASGADSIRAVEPCKQHPGKMWIVREDRMVPLMPMWTGTPMHSRQYADLPVVHVQNASLEIAWVESVLRTGTIAGNEIRPFLTRDSEGLDLNEEADWWRMDYFLKNGLAELPEIKLKPYGN